MAKGLHTQSAVVLFEASPTAEQIDLALTPFSIVRHLPGESADHPAGWMAGRLGVVLSMRRDISGTATVNLFDQRWPDEMGDPKSDPMLFGSWTMGYFGPFTYPGNLERAVQQSVFWDGAAAAAESHRAFVRITTTYVGGASNDAPCLPEGYDALAELEYVTRVAQALLALPGALGYFNPNGEVLRPANQVQELIERHAARGVPPLALWSHVRAFCIEELAPCMIMDSVGMGQLDLVDHEGCFPADKFDPNDVAFFLRNVSEYLRTSGATIRHGDTVNGPGGIDWRGMHAEALILPPRSTLRWFPAGEDDVPARLEKDIEDKSPE